MKTTGDDILALLVVAAFVFGIGYLSVLAYEDQQIYLANKKNEISNVTAKIAETTENDSIKIDNISVKTRIEHNDVKMLNVAKIENNAVQKQNEAKIENNEVQMQNVVQKQNEAKIEHNEVQKQNDVDEQEDSNPLTAPYLIYSHYKLFRR